MTIRSVARLHAFDGEQLTIAQIHARVPVLSDRTLRRYLNVGLNTRAAMLNVKPHKPSQAHPWNSGRARA